MSEILTIASQQAFFSWASGEWEEKTIDLKPSVFHSTGGNNYNCYDNPAFWGPVKPMGLEVFIKPWPKGTDVFEGSVTFNLCNTPSRAEGVYFKFTRVKLPELPLSYRNYADYSTLSAAYQAYGTDPWYSAAPKVVLSGTEADEPDEIPHPESPSRLNTERTFIEFGVIGQTPKVRDVSLLRGAYWLRLSVFQEPEIEGYKPSFACLSMVTDTEHLELTETLSFSYCNDESKLPASYCSMSHDCTEELLKLAIPYANRYTVYYDTGETGRKSGEDVYLRHSGISDGNSNFNPTNFRHQPPDYEPYASDVRSPNSNCSELHGNWLTYGAATLDSRQTHQQAAAGSKTSGGESHTPSFDSSQTTLSVTLKWDTKATFLPNNQYPDYDIDHGGYYAQEHAAVANEDSTVIASESFEIYPISDEVNTYVVHRPCKTINVNDPADTEKWTFVSITFQETSPAENDPWWEAYEVTVTYSGDSAVVDDEYKHRVHLVFDPTVEKWVRWDWVLNAPVGFKLGEFECKNFNGTDETRKEQLAPFGFFGTKDGDELEDKTRLKFPFWSKAWNSTYWPYTPGASNSNLVLGGINYFTRPLAWWRPTKRGVISDGSGFYVVFPPVATEIQPITYSHSIDDFYNACKVAVEPFFTGEKTAYSSVGPETPQIIETQEWETVCEYPEGFEGNAQSDGFHPDGQQPSPHTISNLYAWHSYSRMINVVQERVSMWWLFTPQYEFTKGSYQNSPPEPEEGEEEKDKSFTMLSGNLDVESEGGTAWKNEVANEGLLRLDGIMQFTRRRYEKDFKRHGIAGARRSYSKEQEYEVATTDPLTQAFSYEPDTDEQYKVAVGSIDSGRRYYWAKREKHQIPYESFVYWAAAPWESSPDGKYLKQRYRSMAVLFDTEEAEVDWEEFTTDPTQDGVDELETIIQRTLSTIRVRAYFSAASIGKLKGGEEVTLPCKLYEFSDEWKDSRATGLLFEPDEDYVFLRPYNGVSTEANFRSRLGSDSVTLTPYNDIPDLYDGCKITFRLS